MDYKIYSIFKDHFQFSKLKTPRLWIVLYDICRNPNDDPNLMNDIYINNKTADSINNNKLLRCLDIANKYDNNKIYNKILDMIPIKDSNDIQFNISLKFIQGASQGNMTIIKSIDRLTIDIDYNTAMFYACENNQLNVIRYLIDNKKVVHCRHCHPCYDESYIKIPNMYTCNKVN
jgi:hypothetical protein